MPDVQPAFTRTEIALVEHFDVGVSLNGLVIVRQNGSVTNTPPMPGYVVRVTVRGTGDNPFA
jgi:hypothetical protein